MRQVLVVCSSDKGKDMIKQCIGAEYQIDYASSGVEARQKIPLRNYDVVIINSPLSDEYGTDLAESIVKDCYAGVLLLVKAGVFDDVSFAMGNIGVYCISKPLSPQTLVQGLTLAVATGERVKGLVRKTESLKEKMEEIKLVGRAKLLLITKLGFNESEAHRYIEKEAMNKCVKKSVIALDIIRTYEN